MLGQDFGPNKEYYPLMDKCFDFTDREYIYTLCPFDRASQRGKSGGVETSLGYELCDIIKIIQCAELNSAV